MGVSVDAGVVMSNVSWPGARSVKILPGATQELDCPERTIVLLGLVRLVFIMKTMRPWLWCLFIVYMRVVANAAPIPQRLSSHRPSSWMSPLLNSRFGYVFQ